MPVTYTTHHSKKQSSLTKNSSLRCWGYMPEAGSSWTPTRLISQAAEGKRFVLAAWWSHSTPPPVWRTGTGRGDCWRKKKTNKLWGPADLGSHLEPNQTQRVQSKMKLDHNVLAIVVHQNHAPVGLKRRLWKFCSLLICRTAAVMSLDSQQLPGIVTKTMSKLFILLSLLIRSRGSTRLSKPSYQPTSSSFSVGSKTRSLHHVCCVSPPSWTCLDASTDRWLGSVSNHLFQFPADVLTTARVRTAYSIVFFFYFGIQCNYCKSKMTTESFQKAANVQSHHSSLLAATLIVNRFSELFFK